MVENTYPTPLKRMGFSVGLPTIVGALRRFSGSATIRVCCRNNQQGWTKKTNWLAIPLVCKGYSVLHRTMLRTRTRNLLLIGQTLCCCAKYNFNKSNLVGCKHLLYSSEPWFKTKSHVMKKNMRRDCTDQSSASSLVVSEAQLSFAELNCREKKSHVVLDQLNREGGEVQWCVLGS